MHNTLQGENVDAFDGLYKFILYLYRFSFLHNYAHWVQLKIFYRRGGKLLKLPFTLVHGIPL